MNSRVSLAFFLSCFTAAHAAEPCKELPDTMERAIVDQMNMVRLDPAGYAMRLAELTPQYRGTDRRLSNLTYLKTQEGAPAVEEAIRVLKETRPTPALQWNDCLHAAANDHVTDTGPAGLTGHTGSRGQTMEQRVRRYLRRYRRIGENISYGSQTAEAVVQDLLIDDGVADRGHRKNILAPDFNAAGAACGPHSRYELVCVIDFAQIR
jgi:uncharacterized protein YkwD